MEFIVVIILVGFGLMARKIGHEEQDLAKPMEETKAGRV